MLIQGQVHFQFEISLRYPSHYGLGVHGLETILMDMAIKDGWTLGPVLSPFRQTFDAPLDPTSLYLERRHPIKEAIHRDDMRGVARGKLDRLMIGQMTPQFVDDLVKVGCGPGALH